MNRMYNCFIVAILFAAFTAHAQTIPPGRITDWSKAGHTDTLPSYHTVINIMQHGGVNDGTAANDTALLHAITALNDKPGTIYFPAGEYLFNKSIVIDRDSIIIKGEGSASRLVFDFNHTPYHAIDINGNIEQIERPVKKDLSRGDDTVVLSNTNGLKPGDLLFINGKDEHLLFSAWAYYSTGQVVRIAAVNGDTVQLTQKIRGAYPAGYNAKVKKISPVQNVGIECLYIERRDSTTVQINTINFNMAAECWVTGVESNKSNFAHVAISRSVHMLVRGCYFHHAHSYGEGGEAYGVLLQFTSGDCLVENNIFEHLRHSMLVQAGANGNVFAYNYSFDPYWTQQGLPNNSAGDMVCHGNYPYLNLFEGNIVQNIVVDDSHGINGPYNTFFRNRAESYGIFTNNNPASDSMNYIGNEITNLSLFPVYYLINGLGHFEYGNNFKGIISPLGSGTINGKSLYLQGPPGYWNSTDAFPGIGAPNVLNTGINEARRRNNTNTKTDCAKNPVYNSIAHTADNSPELKISPNPFSNHFTISTTGSQQYSYRVYSFSGQVVLKGVLNSAHTTVHTGQLQPGMYLLEVVNGKGAGVQKKLVKLY